MHTPFGWAGAAASDKGVVAIILPRKSKAAVARELENATCRPEAGGAVAERLLAKVVKQLERYFKDRSMTGDLPLDLHGHTPFQQAVWKAAAEIPCGETRSYAWIAKRIKRPKAARAVGQAMGANPVPLLIP